MTVKASVNLLAEVIKNTPEYQHYMNDLKKFDEDPQLAEKLSAINAVAERHFEMHDEGSLTKDDVVEYFKMRSAFRENDLVQKLEKSEQKFSDVLRKVADEVSSKTGVDFLEGADLNSDEDE